MDRAFTLAEANKLLARCQNMENADNLLLLVHNRKHNCCMHIDCVLYNLAPRLSRCLLVAVKVEACSAAFMMSA